MLRGGVHEKDPMPKFDNRNFADRQTASAKAKQDLLSKFAERPKDDDPAVVARRQEREAILEARRQRAEQRELERIAKEEEERLAREEAERQAELARQREVEERAKAEAEKEAQRKAARDARYAARKTRR